MKRVVFLAALAATTLGLALALVAIRGDGDGAQAAPSAQAATVQVTLQQYSVTANPSSAPAGDIEFVASNNGSLSHEFVIIRTDLAPSALPVVAGQVDENGAGVQVIDEIEPFAPGTQQMLSTNLPSGAYVFICNVPGHYQLGMRTGFTVTEGTATATATATPTVTETATATATTTATATAMASPTAMATATATPAATATTTPVATASPISATVTPTPATQTATPAPTTPTSTATPTPSGTVAGATVTPAAPPAAGYGGLGGNSGLPIGAWLAIGGAAFLALGAAAVTLARRRSSGA